MKTHVFVLGMHRSGTSAFAGSLVQVGVAAPMRVIKSDRHNAKGYFEPAGIVATNEEFLSELDHKWHDIQSVPENLNRLLPGARERASAALDQAFGPAAISVVKDPRLSLLLPIWLDAARHNRSRARIVIMVRHPFAVAASLARRDGFAVHHGLAIWLRNMIDAERASRASRRTIIEAEAFVQDPVRWLDHAGRMLDIEWPMTPDSCRDALTGFIDAAMMRPPTPAPSPFGNLSLQAHDAILRLAVTPDDAGAKADLDRIGDLLDAMAALTKATDEAHRATVSLFHMHDDAVHDLAEARGHPLRTLRRLIAWKTLRLLLRGQGFLPARMVARWSRSAQKRAPDRALRDWKDFIASAPDALRTAPAAAGRWTGARPDTGGPADASGVPHADRAKEPAGRVG